MIVNFFMIRQPFNFKFTSNEIYNKLGENIPYFTSYFGNDYEGILYIFCLDENIDFRKFCKDNNLMYLRYEKEYIDDKQYNNNYKAIYIKNENKYKLVKIF